MAMAIVCCANTDCQMTQDGPELVACPKCGSDRLVSLSDPHHVFVVPATWAKPLTTNDKRFLRSLRIGVS